MKFIVGLLLLWVTLGVSLTAGASPRCNLVRVESRLIENKNNERTFSAKNSVDAMELRGQVVRAMFVPVAKKNGYNSSSVDVIVNLMEIHASRSRGPSIAASVKESMKITGVEVGTSNNRHQLAMDAATYGVSADEALALFDDMQNEMIKQGANTQNPIFKIRC